MRTNLVAAIAIALCSTTAGAQSSSAEAESLFNQARSLMSEKKYADACAAFESSNKLQASATTMYSLGVCREIEGKLATAWGVMIDFERQYRASTDPTISEFVKKARERAKALQPRLSSLTIAVPAASRADDLAIERDGATLDRGTWDRPLPVDGGPHTIAVRRPGYQAWTTTITLEKEGEAQTVTIPSLEPAPVAEEPAKPTPALVVAQPVGVVEQRSKVLPIVFGTGALALGGAAIGFELWGRGLHDDAQAKADEKMNKNDPEAVKLQDRANLRRYLAQGFGVAAIGCAVVSVVLFVRGGSSETSTKTSFAPIVTPDSGGLAVTGAW